MGLEPPEGFRGEGKAGAKWDERGKTNPRAQSFPHPPIPPHGHGRLRELLAPFSMELVPGIPAGLSGSRHRHAAERWVTEENARSWGIGVCGRKRVVQQESPQMQPSPPKPKPAVGRGAGEEDCPGPVIPLFLDSCSSVAGRQLSQESYDFRPGSFLRQTLKLLMAGGGLHSLPQVISHARGADNASVCPMVLKV